MAFREHVSRSLAKSISFRVVVLTSDLVIILFITHKLETALPIILASNLASTLLYYGHERIWNNVHWGKAKLPKL